MSVRNAVVNGRGTNSSFTVAIGVKYHKVPFSIVKPSYASFCVLQFPEFLIVLFKTVIERHRIRERCFMYML